MRIPAAAALAAILFAAAAPAQPTQVEHLKGTILSFAPATQTLLMKTDAGQTEEIAFLKGARVIADQKAALADIKPGDFVASAALKKPDGKLHAQEVRIFPEALRGLGEGHYAMDAPGRSMTNATVEEVNGAGAAAKSGVLKVTFHGSSMTDGVCGGHATAPGKGVCTGQTELVVGPEVPVTRWILGDASWLQKGKAVSLFAMVGSDGKLSAHGAVVEHNGLKPM
ncbi:MAG: hypothetical protein KGJ79_18775 [Alphaproteobacteria bacterium]|nr:hypothetical protein [Alphaproteobacteria bacterium]MDE2113181.1 hypothetical protein [Alphaproteobacteria bacterium]MDE2494226.1 hypothetical protein [Alphaproteobacteria bacterium]